MCMIASWEIELDAAWDRSGLLSLFMKPFDGVVLSNLSSLAPLLELHHVLVHSFLSAATCCWLMADGLVSRGQHRYGGRESLSVVNPLAAFFASLSAFSFPSIPSCPTVYLNVSLSFFLPLRFWIPFAISSILQAKCWPGLLRSDC